MMSECSFQRADGFFIIRVDHSQLPYYLLMQCDTVFYLNEGQSGAFWIVGNITGVDWKNENCSFVHFVIDPFMTYSPMVNWDATYAYVVREHVREDWSGSGNPLFSNMGPAEDFGTLADTPIWTWNKSYKMDSVLVQSPYDESGKANFKGSMENGLFSSLYADTYTAAAANHQFNVIAESKDASINNVVGVYGFPNELSGTLIGTMADFEEELQAVNVAGKSNPNVPDYNNAKCWSAPYCNIRLLASNGSYIDFTPQWFGNDIDTYRFMARCRTSGKQFGGIAGTFRNKNGVFDWKAWNDFTVMLDELPRCFWTADGFTDWQSYATLPIAIKALGNGIRGANALMGVLGTAQAAQNATHISGGNPNVAAYGATQTVMQGAEAVANIADSTASLGAQILQQKATGATVQGGGSFSGLFDLGQEAWGFKVVYYMAQPYVMLCVDSYFDRFGYRINRLKKLELDTRPIWNYVQTSECHVVVSTGIPIIYETAINRILNAGVTIWNKDKYLAGRKIGDFSNPEDNKGIKG